MMLLGNKSDLERRVSEAEVKEWCGQHRVKYMVTSVKNGLNVEECFMELARMIYEEESKVVVVRTESFALGKGDVKEKKKAGFCSK